MRERRRRFIVSLVVASLLFGSAALTALHDQPAPHQPSTQSSSAQPAGNSPADKALGTLLIKGRAPKTGYSRDQFGSGWKDLGDCDVRNHVLQRDMTDVQTSSTTDCTVQHGTLQDPYTGRTIQFTRGSGTSSMVQIDHVVALSDAWQTGAQQLAPDVRAQLANDPLELLAVDGPANQAKSDGDAATWLPSNKSFRCAYVARQVAVKVKYQLWMTSGERDAIRGVLSSCPGQMLPSVPQ
jgi:hypothetical protein